MHEYCIWGIFFFQAEDGIRDLVRSRGLGDVYKRQIAGWSAPSAVVPLSLWCGSAVVLVSLKVFGTR